MAMGDIPKTLIARFEKLAQQDEVFTGINNAVAPKSSTLSTALMKAICFTRSWIEEVSVLKGEQFSARILIIKGTHEDPS